MINFLREQRHGLVAFPSAFIPCNCWHVYSMDNIKIYVQGGMITDVEGLPDGWTYDVIDYDTVEESEALNDFWEKADMPQD